MKGLFLKALGVIFIVGTIQAIPNFSRKYELSCSTCHSIPGYLNDFGSEFKLNGLQTTEEVEEAEALGRKEISSNLVMDRDFPISFRFKTYAFSKSGEDDRESFDIPHEWELMLGGNFGKGFSIYAEFEGESENDYNPEMEMALMGFHPYSYLNFVVGKARIFDLDPYTSFKDWGVRVTRTHKSSADIRITQNRWRLRDAEPLLGLYGFLPVMNRVFYAGGVMAIGGMDDYKDIFGRVVIEPISGIAIGGMAVVAKDEIRGPNAHNFDNEYTRFGTDFQAVYENLQLNSTFLVGKDKNPLGIDKEIDLNALDVETFYMFEFENYGKFVPLLRYDTKTLDKEDGEKSQWNNLTLGLFYYPIENFKLGFEYDLYLKEVIEGVETENIGDKNRLTLILDIYF